MVNPNKLVVFGRGAGKIWGQPLCTIFWVALLATGFYLDTMLTEPLSNLL